MSISQIGLVLDIIGVLILGLESWVKLRTINSDSIVIGHGEIGGFWQLLFHLGYPLLILGFFLQLLGSV